MRSTVVQRQIWLYQWVIILQGFLKLFENGSSKRVPNTGSRMTVLAVDTSNLVADKNTSITSNQEVFPQKSVGK